MAIMNLALAGFNRYRKRRKNLTIALIIIFFIMFFFVSFFATINSNLWVYWVEKNLGGDWILSSREKYVDITKPVDFKNYFDYDVFLEENPRLTDYVSPRLRTGAILEGYLEGYEQTMAVIVVGIDYSREKGMNDYIEITEGRMFEQGANEIILTPSTAANLGAAIGDEVAVYAQTFDGYLNAVMAEVVGFYKVPSTSFIFGNYLGYIPVEVMQELIQTPLVSEAFFLPPDNPFFNDSVKGEYVSRDGLYNISISRAVKLAYDFLRITIILMLGVFCFGIIFQNVTLMNEERNTEIAVYLTYGAKPLWIQGLLLLELIIYVFFCSVIGGIISFAIITIINVLGIYPVDMVTEVLMGGTRFIMRTGPDIFLGTFLMVCISVIVAAVYPIYRSTNRCEIVQLFRK